MAVVARPQWAAQGSFWDTQAAASPFHCPVGPVWWSQGPVEFRNSFSRAERPDSGRFGASRPTPRPGHPGPGVHPGRAQPPPGVSWGPARPPGVVGGAAGRSPRRFRRGVGPLEAQTPLFRGAVPSRLWALAGRKAGTVGPRGPCPRRGSRGRPSGPGGRRSGPLEGGRCRMLGASGFRDAEMGPLWDPTSRLNLGGVFSHGPTVGPHGHGATQGTSGRP